MISIETTKSLMLLSIPASTISFNSTDKSYTIASLTKWLLIYFTDAYSSSSFLQIPTVTVTSTVSTYPSNL